MMGLWYKACPRCGGDLVRQQDIDGGPYVKCLQCGAELTRVQEASLLRLGKVPAAAKEPVTAVHVEGWRRWA